MNNSRGFLRAAVVLATVALQCQVALSANSPKSYDLGKVEGIDRFAGSAQARTLLEKSGFVVADPFFKQIFEPYIKAQLPLFITTDSAWHTYHVLLEEGVKQMEEVQSHRLLQFSRLLLKTAREKAGGGDKDFDDLARFASVGLAFQDGQHRESLTAAERRTIDTLKSGVGEISAPIGLPLSAVNFKAASFYTKSSELADYFAARQWYATVVFRLQDARETRLALKLAWLINSRSDTSNLWHQLSLPFDSMLAKAEDGDVLSYGETARRLFGDNTNATPNADRIAEAQKELDARLSAPRINDQLLRPDDYAQFGKVIKGFRLLPSRQLPCAVTFQQTTDPAIPKRMFPSGLDFLVASPTLRSPAAIRALEMQGGKEVAAAVQKLNCEPFPESLYGESMKLLALLQKPVPAQAPPALRTETWADSQLWTQLGAWAEQRHTWALHAKLNVSYMGMTDTPAGIVAPYPDFFAGLTLLASKTADAMEQAGVSEPFEARRVAREMLSQIALFKQLESQETSSVRKSQDERMKDAEKVGQFWRFFYGGYTKDAARLRDSQSIKNAMNKALEDVEALATRVTETGQPTSAELETLKAFASQSTQVATLLREFAPLCERLSKLAYKSAAGQELTEDDSRWIRNYGEALAKFHFYEGNSYLTPLDNFPMVTRIFANPFINSVLYAGLGRPQALYVIVPEGGKLRLYQGAVMTYREFTRDAGEPLDDESWQKLVFEGLAPSPPAFTRSFYAEADAKELIHIIRDTPRHKDFEGDYELDRKVEQAAQLLSTRATKEDLPTLLSLLRKSPRFDDDVSVPIVRSVLRLSTSADTKNLISLLTEIPGDQYGGITDVTEELAEGIANTAWEMHQPQLIFLLSHDRLDVATASAHILASKPSVIDVRSLANGFDRQPVRGRRLICQLLSKMTENASAQETLLRALIDREESVRWQAVSAILAAKWNGTNSIAALVSRLADTNYCVRFGAAFTLGKLGATESASVLLANLKTNKLSNELSDDEWDRQTTAIALRERGMENSRWARESDDLPTYFADSRVRRNLRRADLLWILRPNMPRFGSMAGLTFEGALVTALGELKYKPASEALLNELGGENHEAAVKALKQIDPGQLEQALFSLALDHQADGAKRGLALNAIYELSDKSRVRDLLPLLDETTVIAPKPRNPEWAWRLCDHTAIVMAKLLDWDFSPQLITDQSERAALIQKLRDWAKKQP